MAEATFDTLATARALREAGMPEKQAEAVTEGIRSAVAEGVATKADLLALELRLTQHVDRQKWLILVGVGALLAVARALEALFG